MYFSRALAAKSHSIDVDKVAIRRPIAKHKHPKRAATNEHNGWRTRRHVIVDHSGNTLRSRRRRQQPGERPHGNSYIESRSKQSTIVESCQCFDLVNPLQLSPVQEVPLGLDSNLLVRGRIPQDHHLPADTELRDEYLSSRVLPCLLSPQTTAYQGLPKRPYECTIF